MDKYINDIAQKLIDNTSNITCNIKELMIDNYLSKN